ncbi:hypothetical protein [Promicromonospora panici]|uniref:hypothetical protein n=1 Tax=Promicromonospora panici TaxID=2219658 RepID=UPI001F5E11C4|nr:hypothetical protein [Promicromonospora panici]
MSVPKIAAVVLHFVFDATWLWAVGPVAVIATGRLTTPSNVFPWKKTTLRPQALREDRILAEAHANGGDLRALCDLFGLSIEAAGRYTLTVGDRTGTPSPAPARPRSRP